ncbi:MAG: hypothetical protein HZA49_01135 [Planctomycetes bacterium]|nr:hypothetical protein [Planctomycetota bacterium]
MRREREESYRAYRSGHQNFYKAWRRLSTPHNDRNSLSIIQRHIPSLSELKRIKQVRIRRIKALVQNGLYDTPQRQIETARRITDILLAVKDREN